jgi:hypothetical protein
MTKEIIHELLGGNLFSPFFLVRKGLGIGGVFENEENPRVKSSQPQD